jgi:hypothetical protein
MVLALESESQTQTWILSRFPQTRTEALQYACPLISRAFQRKISRIRLPKAIPTPMNQPACSYRHPPPRFQSIIGTLTQ